MFWIDSFLVSSICEHWIPIKRKSKLFSILWFQLMKKMAHNFGYTFNMFLQFKLPLKVYKASQIHSNVPIASWYRQAHLIFWSISDNTKKEFTTKMLFSGKCWNFLILRKEKVGGWIEEIEREQRGRTFAWDSIGSVKNMLSTACARLCTRTPNPNLRPLSQFT